MSPERLDCFGRQEWGEAGADHMARYLFAGQFANGKRVLDVGTGFGYGAALLKAAGAASVVAFDIDEAVVAQARGRFGRCGIEFCTANSESFDATLTGFDLIVSFENIEHITRPDEFVRASRVALNPSGVLLCSTPARERDSDFVNGKPKNPFHINEWFEDEFLALMRTGFASTEMYSQVETFSLMKRCQGLDALVRMLSHPLRGSMLHNSLRVVSRASQAVGVKAVSAALKLGGDISGLACPSPADYPVVHSSVRDLFGGAFCHVAICRV